MDADPKVLPEPTAPLPANDAAGSACVTALPVFVNRPNRFASLGFEAWRESAREVVAGREILWRLVKRDVFARYRQSVLGLGWAVLTPLAMVLVFVVLRAGALVEVGDVEMPYALFLCIGFVQWQFFQACLIRTTSALSGTPALVNRVRFPRELLVFAAIGGALFDFIVSLGVLAGFLLWFGVLPAWTVLLVPLLMIVQMLLSLGLGLILAVLNGALRDLGSVVPLAALIWMFLTPVIWPERVEGLGAWLNWVNPMAPLVVSFRDLVLHGSLSLPGPLCVAVLLSVLLVPLGWRMFHVMLPRIAETV